MVLLSDLFSDYPLSSDPNFAGKIVAKKEFKELELEMAQSIVEKEGLFKSQIFIKRMLAPHSTINEQMVIHDVGTGKTCAATAVAEAYKNFTKGTGSKRALVVVKGKTIEDSFKDNLTKYCTKNLYIADTGREYAKAGERAVITKKINEFYDIVHYVELSKDIAKLDDDFVQRKYSDRVIIFDESHNLRMGFFTKPSKNDIYAQEMRELKVYENIHRMLHLAKRRKIILLSATPVVDKVEELALQLNLLLPLNRQIPFDYDWDNPKAQTLEPYFRGLISYVKSSLNVARSLTQGTSLSIPNPFDEEDDIKVKLVLSHMSELQYEQYLRYRSEPEAPVDEEVINQVDENAYVEGKGAFRRNERCASMFVFPPLISEDRRRAEIEEDENLSDDQKNEMITDLIVNRDAISAEAFKKIVEVKKNGDFSFTNNVSKEYFKGENLQLFSSIFYNIIELCSNNPKELAFVFTEFVTGPGAMLMGLCFEQNGYTRYAGASGFKKKIFEEVDENIELEENIPLRDEEELSIKPGRRYVVITGSTPRAYIKNALEIFRHPANRYGDYIQVLIGSNVTKEGISFRNIRQVHIVHPFWNDVPIEQGKGRAFREGAHNDLPEDERYVKVFQHANIAPIEFNEEPVEDVYSTIDIEMYGISEAKRKKISKILRIAKRCATDCILNKKRNQERGETDYTRDCDYDKCNYTCIGSEVDVNENVLQKYPEDDTSYFLYYSDEYFGDISTGIKTIFETFSDLELDQILQLLKIDKKDKKYVVKVLSDLINNDEPILNKFGQISYLKQAGTRYFIQRDINLEEEALKYYSSNLIVNESVPFDNFIEPMKLEEDNKIRQKINALNISTEKSKQELKNLLISARNSLKADLVEQILDRYNREDGKLEEKELFIYNLFENRIYEDEDKNIMFHDLYIQPEVSGKYASTTKTVKNATLIRIYDENGWRYATPEEAPLLFGKIQDIDFQRKENMFGDLDYYGIISLADNEFRIVDNTIVKSANTDKRKVNRGAICENWNKKQDLITILKVLNLFPESDQQVSRERMLSVIGKFKLDFANMSDEDVAFYYNWNKKKKEELCGYIQNYFKENDLIIYE